MSKWFVKYRHEQHSKLRIFCFPYAGGSASMYNDWAEYFPTNADVFAIQAPGRETRFNEAPINDIKELIEGLSQAIFPYLDVPYIFIGHSNGALIAFELARMLQRLGNFKLRHICLSAKRAPHLPPNKEPIFDLPYDKFIEELRVFSTIPESVLNDPKMMEVFMPMLRADFGLADLHNFMDGQLLKANATLFWGKDDKDIPNEDVLAWKKHILGKIESIGFEGGHFFIHHQKENFIQEISKIITNYLRDLQHENNRGLV